MESQKNKLSVTLLIALVGFPQISETIYTPALPSVAQGLNTSAYLVEVSLSIYFLGFAAGVLLWGTFSDMCGRRWAMLLGLLAYLTGTIMCANVTQIEALLTWRFLQAFGASVGSIITQTILRDSYNSEERTSLFSILTGSLALSPAIGPLLGGFISEYFGWRANFWILAVFSIFLFAWTYFLLPETRPQNILKPSKNKMISLFFEMFKNHNLWGHVFLISATNGIIFGFYQEAPFIFIEQMGMNPSHYGLFGLLIATATVVAANISYRQNGLTSSQSIINYGTSCVFTGSLLFSFIVFAGLLKLSFVGIALTIISLFVIFFGIGLIIPNSLSHALRPYQYAAGTAGSFFGGAYYCLIAVFTWLMSLLHNGTAIPLSIYFTILCLLLIAGSLMSRYSHFAEQKN